MIGKSYVNKRNLKLYKVYSLRHCHVLTLCNPMDCSSPSSSVHVIFQAILEWVAISSSKGIFPTQVSNRSPVLASSFLEYLGASCHIKDLKFTSLEDGVGEGQIYRTTLLAI